MALSPDIESRAEFTGFSARSATVEMPNPRRSDGETASGINPRLLTPESFQNLDGYMQQTSLLSLLGSGDVMKIDELRPDVRVSEPPTKEEITMGFLVREITKREKPITVPPIDIPDSLFAQIYALGYPATQQNLAAVLERERQRTQIEFPKSLFTPAENIGSFTAARRYLTNLLDFLRKERLTQKGAPDIYSRDYFKPVDPIINDAESGDLKGKNTRTRQAVDAYVAETILPGVF